MALKDSGANVFINLSVGTFATQAIRKAYDIDWHPLQFIPNASLSVAAFLDPAGLEKGRRNHHQRALQRLARAPDARTIPQVREFLDWMSKIQSGRQPARSEQCGRLRTRRSARRSSEKVRRRSDPRQRDEAGRESRPGNRHASPRNQDSAPRPRISSRFTICFLMRFDGAHWRSFGGIIAIRRGGSTGSLWSVLRGNPPGKMFV